MLPPSSFAREEMVDELASKPFMPETVADMRKMMKTIIATDSAISDELLQMRLEAAQRQKESWYAWWNAVPQANASHDVNLALSTRDRIDRLDVPGIYLYGVDDIICPVALGYSNQRSKRGKVSAQPCNSPSPKFTILRSTERRGCSVCFASAEVTVNEQSILGQEKPNA